MSWGISPRRLALVALPSFFLFLFVLLPLLMVLYSGLTTDGKLSFEAFYQVFSSKYYREVMLFTFVQAFASVLITLALGLPGAFILSNYEFRWKGQIMALSTIPFVLPSVLVVLGFVIFFGNSGVLNDLLRDITGGGGVPIRILYSWKAIILAHAFYNIPLVFRYVSSIWGHIDEGLLEAARNMGASRLRVFKDIELPFLSQAILSSSLLIFIYCFTSFAIVLALGGPRYATMEVTIYTVTNFYGSFEVAAALSLLQIVFLLGIVFAYMKVDVKRIEGRLRQLRSLSSMSSTHKALTAVYSLVVSVLLLGPMASIVHASVKAGGLSDYTLDWFREVLDVGGRSFIGATPLESIANSLIIATLAMMISVIFGIVLSYGHSSVSGLRKLLGAMVMIPLCVSTITLALGYLIVGNAFSIDILLMAIVLIHAVISFPFSFRAVSNSVSKVDRALVEAAQNMGASRMRAFLSIELPLIKGGIMAAAVFSFAISLGELAAAYMLYGGRYTTIPIYIYRYIGGYRFGPAAALGVILMAVSAISFLLIERAGSKLQF